MLLIVFLELLFLENYEMSKDLIIPITKLFYGIHYFLYY
jgi:hypothetical protein